MEHNLHAVVDELLASYDSVGGMNNTDGLNLPSKQAISEICVELLRIFFPGFHDDHVLTRAELQLQTRERVFEIGAKLQVQICKSLRINEPGCPEARAEQVTLAFMQRLSKIREILRTDIEAADEGDPAARSFEEIILAYPCIETIAIQRAAHELYVRGVPLIPRMMTEWAHSRTGIDIHPGAQIGTHFFIDHGTGVVIGETCRIGNHVKLYHGVTLGAKSFQKDEEGRILKGGKRHPNVEDEVTIYPGSTILGGETIIGRRSTIGGNVFLMQSVPPESLVYYEEEQLRIVPKRPRAARAPVEGHYEI